MTFVRKLLGVALVGAVLALPGTALAAVTVPSALPTITDNGGAFVVAYTATGSFVEYIGASYNNLSNTALDGLANQTYSYQLDASFTTWLAANPGAKYTIIAFDSLADPGTSQTNIGLRLSGSGLTTANIDGAAVLAGVNTFSQYVASGFNGPNGVQLAGATACGLVNPCTGTLGQTAYFAGGTSNLGMPTVGVTGTAVGTATGFWQIVSTDDFGTSANTQMAYNTVNYVANVSTSGLVTISAATAAPVPLPAAAWLLISALGGLGVVGRRRAA